MSTRSAGAWPGAAISQKHNASWFCLNLNLGSPVRCRSNRAFLDRAGHTAVLKQVHCHLHHVPTDLSLSLLLHRLLAVCARNRHVGAGPPRWAAMTGAYACTGRCPQDPLRVSRSEGAHQGVRQGVQVARMRGPAHLGLRFSEGPDARHLVLCCPAEDVGPSCAGAGLQACREMSTDLDVGPVARRMTTVCWVLFCEGGGGGLMLLLPTAAQGTTTTNQ